MTASPVCVMPSLAQGQRSKEQSRRKPAGESRASAPVGNGTYWDVSLRQPSVDGVNDRDRRIRQKPVAESQGSARQDAARTGNSRHLSASCKIPTTRRTCRMYYCEVSLQEASLPAELQARTDFPKAYEAFDGLRPFGSATGSYVGMPSRR